jgi:polar amino acid transport system permease protein
VWDSSTFIHYLHSFYLIKGAGISLALSIGAMAIGLMLGTIAALMRRSRRRLLRGPASFYVWLFRGTPVLVQLIIIYTGLPQLGLKLGVISSALIGLGVNEGAYLAEIIRAGISAVPRGQFEAARAIGMTRAVTMRVVLMPQALRIIIPPLGNAFNGLMKNVLSRVGDLDGGTAAAHRIAHPGAVQGAGDLHRGRALLFGAHHAVGLRAGSSAS